MEADHFSLCTFTTHHGKMEKGDPMRKRVKGREGTCRTLLAASMASKARVVVEGHTTRSQMRAQCFVLFGLMFQNGVFILSERATHQSLYLLALILQRRETREVSMAGGCNGDGGGVTIGDGQ